MSLNISTIWLIIFTRNAFDAPEISADLFVYIWDISNSHTSGTSCHRDTRELPLEQRPNRHQPGDPIGKHTDLLKHGYIIVVQNLPFSLGRTACIGNLLLWVLYFPSEKDNLTWSIITMPSQWARWRPKSPASRLFPQPFIQAHIKENTNAPCHWPLTGEFLSQRASYAENVSICWRHHDDRNIPAQVKADFHSVKMMC